MNISQFMAYHTDRSERLRILKTNRLELSEFIIRAQLEYETIVREIEMLESHTSIDAASGTIVIPIPENADKDNQIDDGIDAALGGRSL